MGLTAKDIMTTEVIVASPRMSVTELATLLADNNISGVPVVDYRGHLVGVATEADILRRRPSQNTVQSVMTAEVTSVPETEAIEEIACLLSARKINRAPVVKGGKVVGIVSRADLVKALTLA